MTHKPHLRILNLSAAMALVLGVSTALTAAPLYASLTTDIPSASEAIQAADAAGSRLYFQKAEVAVQLIMGMLLILLGFFLHGFVRSRTGERPVHITVKPKVRQKIWYWMEMRI